MGGSHLLKIQLPQGIERIKYPSAHRVWHTANGGFLSFHVLIDCLFYGSDNEGAF